MSQAIFAGRRRGQPSPQRARRPPPPVSRGANLRCWVHRPQRLLRAQPRRVLRRSRGHGQLPTRPHRLQGRRGLKYLENFCRVHIDQHHTVMFKRITLLKDNCSVMNGLFVAVSLMDEQLLTPNGKPPSYALSLKKYSITAVGPLEQLMLKKITESRKLY